MSDLVSLTCPNCGSSLKIDSTKIKTKCSFCQTEILVKDFITERRVDKDDKIASLKVLADNADKNEQYSKAYGYYEEICKLEPSKENVAYMNFYGYAAGNIQHIESLVDDLYIFEPNRHRWMLDRLRTFTKLKKNREFADGTLTIEQAAAKYDPVIHYLDLEYDKIKRKKCHCGAMLEFNEDVCPKCGTGYTEYQRKLAEDAAVEHKTKKKKIILVSIAVGIPLTIFAVVFAFIYNNNLISNIKQSIQSKDYSAAQSQLDNYRKDNPTRADVYELYADLYLAEGSPQKAVEILEEGLRKCSSGKTDLQNKLNFIKNEYHME